MFDFLTKEKGQPSISRTLMLISFSVLVILGIFNVLGKINGVGIFENLFWSTAGLYFGRRINISKDSKELDKV